MRCVIVVLEKNSNIVTDVCDISQKTKITAAVGLIVDKNNQQVFVTQRREGQSFPGFWEFPGGKQEPGEDSFEALQRELNEEIGIVVLTAFPFLQLTQAYESYTVDLNIWCVENYQGEPYGKEGQNAQWLPIADLTRYPFLEANKQIIEALRSL